MNWFWIQLCSSRFFGGAEKFLPIFPINNTFQYTHAPATASLYIQEKFEANEKLRMNIILVLLMKFLLHFLLLAFRAD